MDTFLWYITVIFITTILIWFSLYSFEKRRGKDIRGMRSQPSVTTTSNVIYTIPTNDPNRFSTNISTTTSLRHHYDLPPSYDQVVIQTVQTPTLQTPQPITSVSPTACTSQLPVNPPSYTTEAIPK
ncbi:hypothetical protein PVAND_008338 [Polypedilum vanderplanki]|uniref:Uncharacterized protein n=1 Tax=Polypedilum vanderplanki TaxID=319348 RepID=A0A9J6C9W6_POLVA|nr:hypothetical protein PVAND_008338 [Polypedilum vanderplanki]